MSLAIQYSRTATRRSILGGRALVRVLEDKLTSAPHLEGNGTVTACVKTRCFSYINLPGSEPLKYATMGQVLEQAANMWPSRAAIVAKDEHKTLLYSELLTQVDKMAAALLDIGLCPGDRLGIWCTNTSQWIVTMLAAARAGIVSVAINPQYEQTEIAYCIKKVGVKCLLVQEELKGKSYYQMLKVLMPSLADGRGRVLQDDQFPHLKLIIVVSKYDFPGVFNYEKLLESSSATAAGEVGRKQTFISPDSCCNIQFTSGTTGQPKAPLLSHMNIVNNGYNVGNRNEYSCGHNIVCVQVPLFHVYGVVVALSGGLQHGTTLVLPSATYSPSANVKALLEEKCTTVLGTPTMHVDLLNTVEKKGSDSLSVRVACTGGSLVSPKLIKDLSKKLKVQTVKSIYGMTETTGVSFQSVKGEDPDVATYSVGKVHDHLEVKVCNPDGSLVPFGSPGELYVRGYNTMIEYWDDEVKTKETIVQGWVRTGDRVMLNEDGYLQVIGRFKDIIIRGGENIAPKEIEDVISSHPDVLECHVFGVSDDRLGEEVCAAVRLRDGATLTTRQTEQHCSGRIAHFKIPRLVKRVQHFPKTASGKVQKNKLREMVERGII